MKAKRFMIVDDDPLNNILSKMVLVKLFGDIVVNDFLIPEVALEYIETEYEHQLFEDKTTLFLDINMPTLTGWEFLEKFEAFSERIKDQFNIYILSSSIDSADIHRANLHPLVIDFIEKPLNKVTLTKMFI